MTMNSQRILTIFILTLSVVMSGACRKRQTATQAPPPTSSAPATTSTASDLHHPETGTTQGAQTKFFKGSIGNSADLQMKLAREGQDLKGSYLYQKVGTKIDLKGTVDV